jgi:two-component system chemotaxis response regulator CheY
MNRARILSVGQCAYDHRNLARRLGDRLSAEVVPADTFDEALESLRAGSYDLVLVNRITDADASAGLDLIRTITQEPGLSATPVMLVSDLDDAQTQAVALGARPGFGKSALGLPDTLARLEDILSQGR